MGNGGKMGDGGERFCYAEKGSPRGELAPVRATERGLLFLHLIVITHLRLDKLGTSPQGEAFFATEAFSTPFSRLRRQFPQGGTKVSQL